MKKQQTYSCGCTVYVDNRGREHNLDGPYLISAGIISGICTQRIGMYALNGIWFSKKEFEELPSSKLNNSDE